MLGDEREQVVVVDGFEFNESGVGRFDISSEGGVSDLVSEEVEETKGVLVVLQSIDEDKVSSTSVLFLVLERSFVSSDGVLSLLNVVLVEIDLVLASDDGGTNDSAFGILLFGKGIGIINKTLEDGLEISPVVEDSLEFIISGIIQSFEEANNSINFVSSSEFSESKLELLNRSFSVAGADSEHQKG